MLSKLHKLSLFISLLCFSKCFGYFSYFFKKKSWNMRIQGFYQTATINIHHYSVATVSLSLCSLITIPTVAEQRASCVALWGPVIFPVVFGPGDPSYVNRWKDPCLPSVSVCLVRQEASQTAVGLNWQRVLSARCEEDVGDIITAMG